MKRDCQILKNNGQLVTAYALDAIPSAGMVPSARERGKFVMEGVWLSFDFLYLCYFDMGRS